MPCRLLFAIDAADADTPPRHYFRHDATPRHAMIVDDAMLTPL